MSQEYTPVDWVDETTSQQGTLINAERLDQMQTAHHYADGFEEVDAIPTEDPGVDYHKVVYCTADTTFYRWDGTQWTADIDEDTKHLLDQEIARATQAEGELAQDIEDEATARANADTALGARIDEEAQFREDADRQIATQIGALNGQVIPLNPGSSTPTIQNAIAANEGNITNLTSVVDGLAYDLGQEVSNRENADTQLAADITAEVQARAAAIASLQAGVYTKTEADNLLATKAPVTALTDGSVTKVGTADLGTDTKPIKLVAGVPTAVGHDLVTTDTAQTITARKALAEYENNRSEPLRLHNQRLGTGANLFTYTRIVFAKTASDFWGDIDLTQSNNGSHEINLFASSDGTTNNLANLKLINAGTDKYVTIPNRAYNASNTTDAVNLALLDAYPAMVRTSGNQPINGYKDFLVPAYGGWRTSSGAVGGESGEYVRIFRASAYTQQSIIIHGTTANNGLGYAHIVMGGSESYNRSYRIHAYGVFAATEFLRVDSGGYNELWIKQTGSIPTITVILVFSTGGNISTNVINATGLTAAPSANDTNPITQETIRGVSVIQ